MSRKNTEDNFKIDRQALADLLERECMSLEELFYCIAPDDTPFMRDKKGRDFKEWTTNALKD